MDKNPVVVFGAGSIGRGLLGQILSRNAMSVLFVEPVEHMRRRLAESGSYTVHMTGRRPEDFVVSAYQMAAPEDTDIIADALAVCPFAATAVGGAHLPRVADLLASTIQRRGAPLPLLLCENWPNAREEMMRLLADKGVDHDAVICVPASVERMARPGEGLDLVVESSESLIIDASAWPGSPPVIDGFEYVDLLKPYYKRKLYTNNAGHVLLAYEGALRGCVTLCEAMGHADIVSRLEALLTTAAGAIHLEYGLSRSALAGHVRGLLEYRYPNKALEDTVIRVGRQPLRKLGPKERLTGLLRLLEKHVMDTEPVYRVIAAAMHYYDPEDMECIEMRNIILRDGPEGVLTSVCGISPGETAFKAILSHYERLGR